ncbi:hypothetical protein BGZ63DRAFT_418102 [Mariannaea sp. PMI_226]|nr:hypothetical protein BGZ63DRAFT_418102 [Mariannaea sp. PMI_226]
MPRWSRGCQACRQRRIGCDAALPSCRQCLVTNRWCSGPIQGPIILDQTKAVTARHRRKSRPSRPSRRSETLAMNGQPSSKLFMGHSRRPWLHALADVSWGAAGPTLDLALQAAATAFCGVNSKNYTVLTEACQLYGQALSCYMNTTSQSSEEPTISKICISVLLSLYEAIWPTNSVAYSVHLTACWKMLRSMKYGPEDIVILRQVAAHVQYQSVYEWNWADLAWLHVGDSQPVVDRLIAELFGLQRMLSRNDNRDDKANAIYHVTRSRINNLWVEYQAEEDKRDRPTDVSSFDLHQYRDAFSALTVAYFSAAWVLLSHVGETNSERIFDCFSYLSQRSIGCAYLRMFVPLTIVALHSPSSRQRALAYAVLDSTSYRAIFTGLSSIALQRIQTTQPTLNC